MCKYRVEGCILQDPVVSEGEWDGWIDVRANLSHGGVGWDCCVDCDVWVWESYWCRGCHSQTGLSQVDLAHCCFSWQHSLLSVCPTLLCSGVTSPSPGGTQQLQWLSIQLHCPLRGYMGTGGGGGELLNHVRTKFLLLDHTVPLSVL